MQEIVVKKVDKTIKSFCKTGAKEDHGTIIVDKESIIYDESGNVLIGIFNFDCDKDYILNALNNKVRRNETRRTDGMLGITKIFGKRPRVTMRQDYCSDASLESENRELAGYLQELGKGISKVYERLNPQKAESHREKIKGLGTEWKYEESIFTSGIINKNNPLPYHYDAGNLQDCFSGMITFKKNIAGGYLMIPEYDLQIRTRDGSVMLFDGQKLLHGVSPITKGDGGHRYTMVFYTMKGLRKCLEPKEELRRIQERKTALYKKRADNLLISSG